MKVRCENQSAAKTTFIHQVAAMIAPQITTDPQMENPQSVDQKTHQHPITAKMHIPLPNPPLTITANFEITCNLCNQ